MMEERINNLEIRTAAYFQSLGFLVRDGVKLAIAAGTAEITDIDVLALRFSVPLMEERIVIDCKDRKKPKPFERILWTTGLSSYSRANRTVVVLPNAPWQAREFATGTNVEILCTQEIENYMKSIQETVKPFGQANPRISGRRDSILKNLEDKDKHFFREDLQLRQMLVIGHPLTNLNRIIRLLCVLGKNSKETNANAQWLKQYICFNAGVIAGLMLVRFAAESKWTPQDDWSDYARKRLIYGDIPPQKARQLAKLALDQNYFGELPKPFYTEEIIGILRLLISKQKLTSLVPYGLDFYLLGRSYGVLDEQYVSPFLNQAQDDVLAICKQILSVVAYAAELPNEIWSPKINL